MPRIAFALLVLAVSVLSACATNNPAPATAAASPTATAVSAEAAANAEQEIRKLHQEYDKAWLEQDAAAFERLLADDVSHVDEKGKVFSKAGIIANARSGGVKFEVGRSDDVKIRIYGDTALVTARWTEKSTTKGKAFAGASRNTVVYVKKNGNWHVVSDQVTLIAPEKPKP